MATTLGFVGLGIMGKGMAKNLILKSNATLVVWNRSAAVCQELSDAFPGKVTIADTARDVVGRCQITFSMLSDMKASEAVYDNPDVGMYAGVTSGKVIVDCSTICVERMMEVSAKVHERGGLFLEAPVSGSKVPAETGQLIFLCGGNKDAFDAASTFLDSMGKAKYFLGEIGQGSKMKLAVNMVMGTMMTALGEGMQLCEKSDIDRGQFVEVLGLGAMACPLFAGKGPAIIKENFATNFPLKHAQKDMKLALDLGQQVGCPLPVAAKSNEQFETMLATHGDLDFAAVSQVNRK